MKCNLGYVFHFIDGDFKKWLNLLLCDSRNAYRSVLRWHINQNLNHHN